MPDIIGLVITTALNTKIIGDKNKISDNSKYITTQEFNKSTTKNSATRLKQVHLVKKNWFS